MSAPTPYPLGRVKDHDPRSLAHPFSAPRKILTRSLTWPRRAPIFDQGNVGSCVGNACAGAYGTDRPGKRGDAKADEPLALSLYSRATALDSYPGTYPPTDTGTGGNAGAKAMREAGLIDAWSHCFTFADWQAAMETGPVIFGCDWYEQMFTPDASGYVTIGGAVAGGHEFLVRGIDPNKQHFLCDNSWSASWGRRGRFWLHFADAERLQGEGGDVTVLGR